MIRYVLPLVLATAAHAQDALDAEGFAALVQGRTLSYSADASTPYGVEKYLPGQRVVWSFLDGQCEDGRWYEENGNICFVYEFDPDPQCWKIFAEGDGLRAIFMNDPGTSVLYDIGDGSDLLICGDYGV